MMNERIFIDEDEIFFIPYREKFIAYAPLRGAALLLNQKAVNKLKKGNVNDDEFMNNFLHIIRKQKAIDLAPSFQYNDNEQIVFKPTLVGLALTTDCNLRCAYCHANAGDEKEVLDFELAKITLDIIHANATELNEKFDVGYAGFGEPSLAWDLIEKTTEYIKNLTAKSGTKYVISMATNGVYSLKKAEYIAQYLSAVSLSLDGTEDIQNKHRPFPNGKGSFDIVYRTAKYFWEKNFPFSIRATISDYSVNRMEEIFTFCQEEFPGIRVGFEALNPLGRGVECSLKRPSTEDFTKNFIKVLLLSEKIGGTVINSGLGRVKEIKTVFCKSLSAPSVTVTPSGQISACQRDNAPNFFHYGYIDRGRKQFVIDYDKVKRFRQMDVRAYPECQDCFCKYHCGGDCQDLRRVGVLRCDFIRELTKFHLLKLLNQ